MAISDTRAWIEVDLDALRANYETVRRVSGAEAAIIPMVKADAYGLGVERVVRALEARDPWGYGVATAGEGAELRSLGVDRPILVLGPLPAGDVMAAAGSRLTASMSSLEGLEAWITAAERVGARLDFHVEVDTGMGRSGFDWRTVGEWAEAIGSRLSESMRWSGVFTHFHSADEAEGEGTARQWERFCGTLVQLPVAREHLVVHASNSAAALRWPEYGLDAVRPGIFLFGGDPAPGRPGVPAPRPVASLRARLALTREVAPGSTVGYGATYVAASTERWGALTIGYGDGLPRALGNCGTALIRGRRVPIIGRVSMDLTTVLLDDVPDARPGDVATLVGQDGTERITVDEVAAEAGTIGYEILTGLGTRLPRIYVGGSDEIERA